MDTSWVHEIFDPLNYWGGQFMVVLLVLVDDPVLLALPVYLWGQRPG